MELKGYQKRALESVKSYLQLVAKWEEKNQEVIKLVGKDMAVDSPAKAWEEAETRHPYSSRKNGVGKEVPNFCLKIPTGGGKTLLAVKTVDIINSTYLKKQYGLVLWIVPTSQIYNQTLQSLRDREHPYRQFMDLSSGGKTMILERTDRFSPSDIEENLVVMLLMLPAANRQTKETLRVFRDSGAFTDFFPPEDEIVRQKDLLDLIPNLDTFGTENEFWQRQIKTSLGNVLRLISPIVILDEGQKAYSLLAQQTIYGFNPSIIVELSATPPAGSNILVDISGIELKREEMIKLDLHVVNKASPDWKETLLAAHNQRELLEEKAKEYQQNTNNYIRPICLIQAERTGKDQRDGKFIHSEDVREYLIKGLEITPEQIAVKTSDKDELKEIDDIGGLLSPGCPIRYIITKQALQEGWDCPFAYVLATLTNPSSKTAMTQLVGRILRQPYARKTKVIELDESYVFCFQQRGGQLLGEIKKGFEQEGLGDLVEQVVMSQNEIDLVTKARNVLIRPEFEKATEKFILPIFAYNQNGKWQPVNYETDVLSKLDWQKIDIDSLNDLALSETEQKDIEQIATIVEGVEDSFRQIDVHKLRKGNLNLDPVFLTRQISDIVPNPWIAHDIGDKVLKLMLKSHDKNLVINNFVFIIEETRRLLQKERDRLAKDVFDSLMSEGTIRLLVVGKDLGFRFRKKYQIQTSSPNLLKSDRYPLK